MATRHLQRAAAAIKSWISGLISVSSLYSLAIRRQPEQCHAPSRPGTS